MKSSIFTRLSRRSSLAVPVGRTILAAAALAFAGSTAAQAQSEVGGEAPAPLSCPGCTGNLVLGTVVSVPGITLSVEECNSQGVTNRPKANDGKCKIATGNCVQDTGCVFHFKLTMQVAVGMDVEQEFCRWIMQADGTMDWDCITVMEHFTSEWNGSHIENAGSADCGSPAANFKISLGGASVQYTQLCSPCD